MSSASALLWRLQDREDHEAREETTLKLVAWSFFVLSAWVAWEAGSALITREAPAVSRAGIVIAALSVVVMPILARKKRLLAGRLASRALESDSRQTSLCAYLSAVLLAGLALNALLGWWWADPVAALAMVPIIVNEGVEAFRGERCDDCA